MNRYEDFVVFEDNTVVKYDKQQLGVHMCNNSPTINANDKNSQLISILLSTICVSYNWFMDEIYRKPAFCRQLTRSSLLLGKFNIPFCSTLLLSYLNFSQFVYVFVWFVGMDMTRYIYTKYLICKRKLILTQNKRYRKFLSSRVGWGLIRKWSTEGSMAICYSNIVTFRSGLGVFPYIRVHACGCEYGRVVEMCVCLWSSSSLKLDSSSF